MRTSSATAVDFVGAHRGAGDSRIHRWRALAWIGIPAALLAVALIGGASPASAAYLHTTVTGEYGKEGPKASGVGNGCNIAYQTAQHRLYLFADEKIYGLNRTAPGTVAPLGGAFPISAGIGSSCGDRDLVVDNSGAASAGNIYAVPSNTSIYGWLPGGSPTGTISVGGETCGVAVSNTGEVWGGQYSPPFVKKFTASGTEIGSLSINTSYCKLEVDPSNNDLYVAPYSFGVPIRKYTAASGYSTFVNFPSAETNNPGMAINGAAHRLYVANGTSVRSFDTTSGALAETISVAAGASSVAVDETTDTLFAAPSGGVIKEISGAVVPDVTTGEPISNSGVSGHVDPAGGGEVTQCYFEWGTVAGEYTGGQEECTPSTFSGPQDVTAALPGLVGETTYHYRLVAGNANGVNFGGDQTITPHNVSALKTEAASEIDRTTVRLNGSYEGTNEETKYWFEWREGNSGTFTKTPVEEEGTTIGPTNVHYDLGGLTAGKNYTYRVAAENSKGESVAGTVAFQTALPVKNVVTKPATEIDKSGATLNGSLDADGFGTTYYFEWGKDTGYGQAIPLPPGTAVPTTAPGDQDVAVRLDDLEEGTTYHYRLVAINSFGETRGGDQSFSTRQPPSITSFNATNLTASSADLIATIVPNGFETNYWFEYGTTDQYGSRVPIPDGLLTEDLNSVHSIVEPISGLQETTYHFRLTAESEWGSVTTEDQTFDFNVPRGCPNQIIRQRTGSAYVPDCRAYELVSAANANGTALFAIGPTSGFASGKFAYGGFLNAIPGSGEPQNSAFGAELYMATRKQDGWVTRYVGVPGSEGIGQSSAPGLEYGTCYGGGDHEEGFECPGELSIRLPSDKTLSHILVWDRKQNAELAGGPKDGTNAPKVYDNEGHFVDQLPTNHAEVPDADKTLDEGGWIGAARISGDYTHYAFSSIKAVFAPGGLLESPGSVYDNDLQTGSVTVVSKTENGEDVPLDPTSGIAEDFLRVPAISDDGTRILIGSAAPPNISFTQFAVNYRLYMSVNRGGGQYEHFDVSKDKNGVEVGVEFKEMTSDGSEVFFTTEKQMTPDDTDTSRDLYVWSEAAALANEPALTRVSDSGNLPGNSDSCAAASWTQKCDVRVVFRKQATIFDPRIARDSGEIYFYSPEQLDGARGVPNKRNLYVWRDGHPQFVATFEPSKQIERINVSPNGDFMAFITKTRMTAYDNAGFAQMYLYDPAARTIKCVSCRPDGQPPTSDAIGARNGLFMTFDGRTFWTTKDSLVPRDANQKVDVYEFVQGRPQLITTGTSDDTGNEFQVPGLAGVSGDGVDVYFATYATLVPQDENGDVLKFYDARSNGGIPTAPEITPCQAADECHGEERVAAAPPEIGTSARLGDGGNYKAAKKKNKKKKCGKKGKGKQKCRSKKAAHRRSRHG